MNISTEIYDYIQSLMPNDLQFVNPYLDTVPVPLGTYAVMNVLDIQNLSWIQQNQESFNEETGIVTVANRINRKYTVQFDFYNENAESNANNLQVRLLAEMRKQRRENKSFIGLGIIGNVENRTFLQENKKFNVRYGFNMEFFKVDTYLNEDTVVENVNAKLVLVTN